MDRSLGLAAIATLAAMALLRTAATESPPPAPLTVVGVFDHTPASWPYVVDRGSFVFSQYSASGNAYDVVALNLQTQALTILAREIHGARFLARDDRYIVISDPRPGAERVRVFDASSGNVLARINLRDGASWARIHGERLLLIQQYENTYNRSTQATVFELPALKLLKSVELGTVFSAAAWGQQTVTVGKDIRVYDADWNLAGAIEFPSAPPSPGGYCVPQLRVAEDQALTTLGCGYIAVFDLKARKVTRVIAAQSGAFNLAIAERLIFAISRDSEYTPPRARVFDLGTGRLLATLPIAGTSLFVHGDRLLAIDSGPQPTSRLTLYSIDAVALRSGKWQ